VFLHVRQEIEVLEDNLFFNNAEKASAIALLGGMREGASFLSNFVIKFVIVNYHCVLSGPRGPPHLIRFAALD
jgi:hypothetical protein